MSLLDQLKSRGPFLPGVPVNGWYWYVPERVAVEIQGEEGGGYGGHLYRWHRQSDGGWFCLCSWFRKTFDNLVQIVEEALLQNFPDIQAHLYPRTAFERVASEECPF